MNSNLDEKSLPELLSKLDEGQYLYFQVGESQLEVFCNDPGVEYIADSLSGPDRGTTTRTIDDMSDYLIKESYGMLRQIPDPHLDGKRLLELLSKLDEGKHLYLEVGLSEMEIFANDPGVEYIAESFRGPDRGTTTRTIDDMAEYLIKESNGVLREVTSPHIERSNKQVENPLLQKSELTDLISNLKEGQKLKLSLGGQTWQIENQPSSLYAGHLQASNLRNLYEGFSRTTPEDLASDLLGKSNEIKLLSQEREFPRSGNELDQPGSPLTDDELSEILDFVPVSTEVGIKIGEDDWVTGKASPNETDPEFFAYKKEIPDARLANATANELANALAEQRAESADMHLTEVKHAEDSMPIITTMPTKKEQLKRLLRTLNGQRRLRVFYNFKAQPIDIQKSGRIYIAREVTTHRIMAIGDQVQMSNSLLAIQAGPHLAKDWGQWIYPLEEETLKEAIMKAEGLPKDVSGLDRSVEKYRFGHDGKMEFQFKGESTIESIQMQKTPYLNQETKSMMLEAAAGKVNIPQQSPGLTL